MLKPRRNIREDILDILTESDPDGITDPRFVMLAIVADNKESIANINNIVTWIRSDNINDIRFVIIDEIDNKDIWSKLRIYDTKTAPRTIIADNNLSIVDIISGVISVDYIRNVIKL